MLGLAFGRTSTLSLLVQRADDLDGASRRYERRESRRIA
jgi:hypothetical protein